MWLSLVGQQLLRVHLDELLPEFAVLEGLTSQRFALSQKKKTLTFLCLCACPGVVLDIREGQRRAPLRLTFCWAGGGGRPPPPGVVLDIGEGQLS